jgi:hypothetical protein
MATFPCSQHGLRYSGPQRTAYPALMSGSMTMREKRRLCADCFKQLCLWCVDNLYESSDGGVHELVDCAVCQEPADWRCFVTVYDHGQEREDFYGGLCGTHAATEAAIALFGPEAALPTL